MKPENMLKMIDMLMERINTLESENSMLNYLSECYKTETEGLKAEVEKLKAETHALIAENHQLKGTVIDKQNKLTEAAFFASRKDDFADD